MAVEGILDQFCISRASPGQITKVRHSALAAPRTAFPFQVGAAAPHMRKCSAVGGDNNDNDEANGCAGIGGLHDDPSFCPKSNESLGPTRGGRQRLPAEDLGWLGNARCGGAEAVLRAGTAR